LQRDEVTMSGFRVLILLMVLSETVAASTGDTLDRRLRFDVTDSRKEITKTIDVSLLLRVVRVGNQRAKHLGWEVQVVERAQQGRGHNLLRANPFSGGPHPSDILAWLSRDRLFPDQRLLIVPGYPYEIQIHLIDCRTEQIDEDASFTSGQIEIRWRRLDLAGLPAVTALRAIAR
jgi:hypothetical protein